MQVKSCIWKGLETTRIVYQNLSSKLIDKSKFRANVSADVNEKLNIRKVTCMESIESDALLRLRIGIAYNLKKHVASDIPDAEAEYDDFDTILAIKNALDDHRFRIELFEATEELPQKLKDSRPDMVFNIAEGTGGRGREAQVPAILNLFQIPFTGSDETTLCIALDKALTKRILATYHIRTPKYKVMTKDKPLSAGGLTYPVIVKPNAEGSSKGISGLSFVSSGSELRSILSRNIELYNQDMLAEEYIDGREFTVGILGNGKDTRIFPPMEIIYKDKNNSCNIYSYEVKKNFRDYISYECPARTSASIRTEIEMTARKIYEILNCRDFARIDFRLSSTGQLYFIEINPLPGLAPGYSDFPMIAEFNGMDYASLVRSILFSALKRYRFNF
jgi:D-alanine-D-alanine ligase